MDKKNKTIFIGVLLILIALFWRFLSKYLSETKYSSIVLVLGIVFLIATIFGMSWWAKRK